MVVFGQKLKYLIDKNRPKEEHMKINFYYFQIHKWMLQTVRAEKVDEKKWGPFSRSMLSFWVKVG